MEQEKSAFEDQGGYRGPEIPETTDRIREHLGQPKADRGQPVNLDPTKEWKPAKPRAQRLVEARSQIAKIRQQLHPDTAEPKQPEQ